MVSVFIPCLYECYKYMETVATVYEYYAQLFLGTRFRRIHRRYWFYNNVRYYIFIFAFRKWDKMGGQIMDEILQIKDLTKKYGDFKLDQVSFSIPKGSIMGLIGENGAEKAQQSTPFWVL